MVTRIVLAGILALSGTVAFAEKHNQQPQNGSLLDGLTPPASSETQPADTLTPADTKLNDGAPKLRYSLEVGGKNKVTRHFHEEQCYLELKNGDRLNGFITLRAERDKSGGAWKLSQVGFREASNGAKQKLSPADVEDFTMNFTMADYKGSGDPARNFTKGSLKLMDGTELQGYVALAKIWAAGSIGGSGSRAVWLARDESANIEEFKPAKVQEMVQVRADGEFRRVNFYRTLVPVTFNGKNLMLFRNPYPTTRATGFLAGLRGFGGDVAGGLAAGAAAQGAAKAEAERRVNAGQDIGSVAAGSAANGQAAADLTSAALSDIDLRGYKTEYVIRNLKTGYQVIVTDENIAAQVGPLLNACPTTARMSNNERKDQLRMNNLQKLIGTLDQCF